MKVFNMKKLQLHSVSVINSIYFAKLNGRSIDHFLGEFHNRIFIVSMRSMIRNMAALDGYK